MASLQVAKGDWERCYKHRGKRMEQQGILTDIWRSITGVVKATTRLQNQWKKDDTKYTTHMRTSFLVN